MKIIRRGLTLRLALRTLGLLGLLSLLPDDLIAADQRPAVPGVVYIKFRQSFEGSFKARVEANGALAGLLGPGLRDAEPLLKKSYPGPVTAGVDRIYRVTVDPNRDVHGLAAKLSGFAEVEYAEPVFLYDTTAVPNDVAYGTSSQDYLQNLQLEPAWDVIKSESNPPVVCIVDGGTNWQHEDINANMWVNLGEIPGNSLDDDLNGYVDDVHGWDFREGDADPRGNWAETPGNANHGTHTGGLLAAVTDNATGMASPSWNPQLMAVNASGNNDGSIVFGYFGVIYAAENGADIVSLSWGGTGGAQIGQDIVDFATAQGTLVIGAAGNHNSNAPFYPAAYRNVIAVANVWGQTDVRYSGPSGSGYGGWLDVAAPGAAIYSTFDFDSNNAYGSSTGTSMSAPIAAAVAALVKAQNPTWGPLQVGEQLRITCDDINAANPGFADQLGKGRINAFRAVTESSPAVRVVDWTYQDADGNGELNQGENVVMDVTARNYLSPAMGLELTLSSASPYVTITDGSETVGTIIAQVDAELPAAFSFSVAGNAPPGTRLDLRIDMNGTDYQDFQFVPATLEPVFETHDINHLEVSVTSTGNIGWVGFAGGLGGERGEGLRFKGSGNLLFEGALLLGTSAGNLSDAARINTSHTDFVTQLDAAPSTSAPGSRSDQEIQGAFDDAQNTTTPLGVEVDFTSFAYADSPYDDFIVVRYDIRNTTSSDMNDLWVGYFFDWDIDENQFFTNEAGYDATRGLGYAFDATAGLPYVGILGLTGSTTHYSALRNDGSGQPFSVYDGLTKEEKWTLLSSGTGITTAGPADISNALSTGPYYIAAGQTLSAWFALLAGEDLSDLLLNSDMAVSLWSDSLSTSVGDEYVPDAQAPTPSAVFLEAARPNPFNPGTRLRLHVERTRNVRVQVFDVRGSKIRDLLQERLPPGQYTLSWDGRDDHGQRVASGVYLARLYANGWTQTRRLVLAK